MLKNFFPDKILSLGNKFNTNLIFNEINLQFKKNLKFTREFSLNLKIV